MTTINCALNCQYQKEGKCTLDNANEISTLNEACAYFSPPDSENDTKKAKLS